MSLDVDPVVVEPPAPAAPSVPDRAEAPAPVSRLWSIAGTVLRRSIVPIAFLVLWQIAASAGWLHRSTLASPLDVWAAFRELWGSGEILTNVLISLRRVAIGSAIGVSIGVVLALVAGLSKLGEELIDAPMQMLRTLPFLGLLPLLLVWLGIGEGLKIGLVVIGVIFPIYLNFSKGIRGVDHRFAELSRSVGVGRWGLIRQVILPGALPSFLVGLRYALGIAWLALVVGETVNAGDKGIGFLMMNARELLRTDIIVLGLVIYSLLGLGTDVLVRFLERRALPWRPDFVS